MATTTAAAAVSSLPSPLRGHGSRRRSLLRHAASTAPLPGRLDRPAASQLRDAARPALIPAMLSGLALARDAAGMP
jgi:hypothetical protein